MNGFYRFLLSLSRVIMPCKIINKENIPSGSAVIVANHFCATDPVYIANICNKNIKFLAKKEIFEKNIFAKTIKNIGAIPVDRENPDMSSLVAIMKQLKSGGKIVIFPEGTRNRTGSTELQKIKGGSAVFAIKYKVPIIPVMFEKKSKLFRKSYLMVGEPVDFSEFYNIKLTDETIEKADIILVKEMKKVQEDLNNYLVENKIRKVKNK